MGTFTSGVMIMPLKTITAAQQRRDAQLFNVLSCSAVILMPLVIPWIAASIFVHASIAHHPNLRVREFLYPGGYRFYGLVGALVIALNFSSQMAKWVGGGMHLMALVWIVGMVVVVPLGVRDILRARRENWQDITVEVEHV
jgi:hypothetical protein